MKLQTFFKPIFFSSVLLCRAKREKNGIKLPPFFWCSYTNQQLLNALFSHSSLRYRVVIIDRINSSASMRHINWIISPIYRNFCRKICVWEIQVKLNVIKTAFIYIVKIIKMWNSTFFSADVVLLKEMLCFMSVAFFVVFWVRCVFFLRFGFFILEEKEPTSRKKWDFLMK